METIRIENYKQVKNNDIIEYGLMYLFDFKIVSYFNIKKFPFLRFCLICIYNPVSFCSLEVGHKRGNWGRILAHGPHVACLWFKVTEPSF